MRPNNSRQALFAVLATALLLTSGTAGVASAAPGAVADEQTQLTEQTLDADDEATQNTSASDEDGAEIITEFRDSIESLDTVQFTRTEEMTFDNDTTTQTVRVLADIESEQKRIETLNTTMGSNTTMVWEDGTVTTYYADENRVTEFDVSGTTLLPRVQSLANESMLSYEYLGTETIDGQETYVLEAVRDVDEQPDAVVDSSATLYIDQETHFPVQMEFHTTSDDLEYRSTVNYENVTLGEEIPDSAFELDLPGDVEDNRGTASFPDFTEYDSYDNLVSSTDLSVPDKTVADEFTFESGFVLDEDNINTATLTYADGNESVSVTTRSEAMSGIDYDESDLYEEVTIGDTTGYLYTSDSYTSLYVDGDQPYTIHGELDEETIRDIAESLLDK